jgi:hypothetical protein
LKELEGVDSSVLGPIYEYKLNEMMDDDLEAKRITKEYKMNYLDPSYYVVDMKNERQWKNATKRKRVLEVKNK